MLLRWIIAICVAPIVIGGNPDKVRLKDIDVLTLHWGQYTAGRRSHPVPQLQCTGGTAGCNTFVPKVVQCYNRGSNGYDIQWECKTDMDNAYRFGQIAVTCEGYDYPEDPYVLRGSCGLEYELDLTKEGYQHQYPHAKYTKENDSVVGSIVSFIILVVGVIVVGTIIYSCLFQSQPLSQQNYDPPPPYPGYSVPPTAPPPPGFRPDYVPSSDGAHHTNPPTWQPTPDCHQTHATHSSSTSNNDRFWSGAATGGVLGYLLGSRGQNRQYSNSYCPPHQSHSSWWSSNSQPHQSASSWWSSSGTTSGSNSYSSPSSSNASTGTRTASGFGGTRRR